MMEHLHGYDLDELTSYLQAQKLVLTTAESCTAGLVAAMLGDCPGGGEWLDCGFVTYSVDSKYRLLGVSLETIEQKGLTSEEVAVEMAMGALRNSRANVSIANTGLAGPGKGDDGTPAGTICFAWGFREGGEILTYAETRRFEGERNTVRKLAAEYGLSRILHYHNAIQQP
jgi:nicotinamide-nucleotide amidase